MKQLLPVVFFILLVFPGTAYAQDSTPSATTRKDRVQERKETLQQRRAEIKENAEKRLEELKAKLEQARNVMKARRETFREKVQTIKDTRKQNAVNRVDQRIATVNKNHTDRFSKALAELERLLGKISDKTTQMKAEGKDTTALEDAIALAQQALSDAKTAVEEQAGKEYIAAIADETTLRVTVGTTISQFRLDLNNTRKSVVNAKQAVLNAARAARVQKREQDATQSAQTE